VIVRWHICKYRLSGYCRSSTPILRAISINRPASAYTHLWRTHRIMNWVLHSQRIVTYHDNRTQTLNSREWPTCRTSVPYIRMLNRRSHSSNGRAYDKAPYMGTANPASDVGHVPECNIFWYEYRQFVMPTSKEASLERNDHATSWKTSSVWSSSPSAWRT